jgi:heat shock protein HtpX
MSNKSGFTASTVSAMDWRSQLARNERRTYFVIALFIGLYILLGLLVDVYISEPSYPYLTLSHVFLKLATFQIMPLATLVMGGVAAISIAVTYAFYDKLMLLGTEYIEVTPESSIFEEKQLYNIVDEMRVAAGLKYMPKVYLIDADYMNAFASGYSEKSAMVAVTRGLMGKLTRSELQAVMAHEISHVRHHDIKLTLMASVLSNLILIVIDILFYSTLMRRNDRRTQGLMIAIMILRYVLPIINVLLILYLSRTREYMADAGCVELMRDNEPLAQALLKIHEDHQLHSEAYSESYGKTAHEGVRRAAYVYDPSQAGISTDMSLGSMFSTHPDINSRLAALGFKVMK